MRVYQPEKNYDVFNILVRELSLSAVGEPH